METQRELPRHLPLAACRFWCAELLSLLAGPIFSREFVAAPRRVRCYVSRAAYAGALLVLLATAWQLLTGARVLRDVDDLAHFSVTVFQVLAPLQLMVSVFFAAVSAALGAAQEKDRRTLDLLLITRLTNAELVLGKLTASLLDVLVLLAAGAPVFAAMMLWGGLAQDQLFRVGLVTVMSVVLGGSLGSTLGLWREKTFQSIALTTLGLAFWTIAWEAVRYGTLERVWPGLEGSLAAVVFSPWHAVLDALRPLPAERMLVARMSPPLLGFVAFSAALAVALNGIAAWRLRAWNIAHDVHRRRASLPPNEHSGQAIGAAPSANGPTRPVWDNPILWREIRTWAYGRRTLLMRLLYLLLFALATAATVNLGKSGAPIGRFEAAAPMIPLFLLSLMLINAQSVTGITSERDSGALDLLLVTDITPLEFVFGKLAGAIYNTKEMILAPLLLAMYLWHLGGLSAENLVYLTVGWLVMVVFAAVLGLHTGMSYVSSRAAIGVSLGTLFFLFVGVATTIRIMVAFSGSFEFQLQPFLAAMVGGGIGLYVALGARNPSPAIRGAALVCPFATFYALTSFLLNHPLAVLLVIVGTYGFATAAMLVPAIHEFDVATGRTTTDDS